MTPAPYKRPRRLSPNALDRRFRKGIRGECFEYANAEIMAWTDAGAPLPAMRVVQGSCRTQTLRYDHAWVERGGVAYDWQMFALDGGEPLPVAAFRRSHAVRNARAHNLLDVCRGMGATGHHGPWTHEEVAR